MSTRQATKPVFEVASASAAIRLRKVELVLAQELQALKLPQVRQAVVSLMSAARYALVEGRAPGL